MTLRACCFVGKLERNADLRWFSSFACGVGVSAQPKPVSLIFKANPELLVQRPMSGLDPAIQNVLAAQDSALQSKIGAAVAAKALSAVRQQGEAVLGLLDDAVQLSKSAGAGENFDAQA